MDPGVLVFLGVVFTVVMVVAIVWSARQAAARRDAMAAYAASRGWRFEAEQPLLVDRFGGAPFGLGFGRRAFNVVYGAWEGRDFCSFDYVYKTQSSNGKTTTTTSHPFSVLAMSMSLPMPALSVDPEGLFDALADAVSGRAIDLELEEFNQAFTVRCPDRKFASDVLHPQMMEFLLHYRAVGWRFERDSLLIVSKGQRAPVQVDATLAFMDGLTDRIPEFVWVRLRGGG